MRYYSTQPAAGGILTFLGGAVKTISGIGSLFKSKKAAVTAPLAAPATTKAAIPESAIRSLMGGGGGGGGISGGRRRGKGISARELRGFRKVARLLKSEGMVSKRARGRKK
jgi:hypothetical protein